MCAPQRLSAGRFGSGSAVTGIQGRATFILSVWHGLLGDSIASSRSGNHWVVSLVGCSQPPTMVAQCLLLLANRWCGLENSPPMSQGLVLDYVVATGATGRQLHLPVQFRQSSDSVPNTHSLPHPPPAPHCSLSQPDSIVTRQLHCHCFDADPCAAFPDPWLSGAGAP